MQLEVGMGTLIRVSAVLALLLGCAACGGSHFGWDSGSGIEYIFMAGEPYDFSGSGAADPQLREAVTALLTNRTVYFYPQLHTAVSPNYYDGTEMNSTVAYSRIGNYGVLIPGVQPMGGNTAYSGEAVYGVPGDPGQLIFHFGHDITAMPQQPIIKYVFDYGEANALVQDLKDWRGGTGSYIFSENSTEVEVTITGNNENGPWTILCKQDFRCLAFTYFYC
jgi:hypothetical protein